MLHQLSPPPSPPLQSPTPDLPSASAPPSSAELSGVVPVSQASGALQKGSLLLAQATTYPVDEAPTQFNATNDSEEEEADKPEDISINLIDDDVRQHVTDLIRDDACERHCLEGKAGELEHLTYNTE
ncbi:hypothetical protein F442_01453 [Phytophthora nicotianae P10297]|uniref:Uncharacterized protein n=1 Tax=Phytophthora nicotianae P10297 TaxID=1317064 RepID=W3A3B7_PHYNI|nr:hypothetical protein F442_01453 [Phytophthora nicotianae P10297]